MRHQRQSAQSADKLFFVSLRAISWIAFPLRPYNHLPHPHPGARMSPDFQINLEQYAALAVKVGLNLQPGQRLFLGYNTPLDAAPLVRAITACAYQAGALLVEVLWRDEELLRLQFKRGPRESF